MTAIVLNALRKPGFSVAKPAPESLAFHRRLPGYAPTPLRALPELARALGVGEVLVKDESERFGLPAYKVLGASWATYRMAMRALAELGGDPVQPEWNGMDDLRALLAPVLPRRLVTATDGNHGRGVARVARWLAIESLIYLPRGTVQARITGIESEGGTVVVVDGTYDEAVARAAAESGPDAWLVQDHGWPGYEEIPDWVAEGYETLFLEAQDQWTKHGWNGGPDVVLVQIGVGTLAAAAVRHFRSRDPYRPVLLGVEPERAACALAAVAAGAIVTIPVDATASIMAGLNCGTVSSAAWPDLRDGMDGFIAVSDEAAREAMRTLAHEGVVSGESGSAGLAGLLTLGHDSHAERWRAEFRITPRSRVLLISTEGATDPEAYRGVVGG